MDWFLLLDEGVQTVEDGLEIHAPSDLWIGANELAEVRLLFPGAHRVPLDQPVGVVAAKPGVNEREEEAVAEDEPMTRLEIAPHALWIDDESAHDPGEPVQHVVEREERVRNHDTLCGRLGDIAFVPEGHVLEA